MAACRNTTRCQLRCVRPYATRHVSCRHRDMCSSSRLRRAYVPLLVRRYHCSSTYVYPHPGGHAAPMADRTLIRDKPQSGVSQPQGNPPHLSRVLTLSAATKSFLSVRYNICVPTWGAAFIVLPYVHPCITQLAVKHLHRRVLRAPPYLDDRIHLVPTFVKCFNARTWCAALSNPLSRLEVKLELQQLPWLQMMIIQVPPVDDGAHPSLFQPGRVTTTAVESTTRR